MKLVEVYRAKSAIDARLMCGVLNDSGITTRIEGEWLDECGPFGWISSPRVIVSDSQAEDAREIIQVFERARELRRSATKDESASTGA